MASTAAQSAAAQALVEKAFARLLQSPGFVERTDQKQLALLLADCIEGRQSGCFEAPTGLGKSLAALIPAIACAIASERRTVIATYTNVLAEQYWRKDLPLALSLFDVDSPPSTQFLIGRQRYACVAAAQEHSPPIARQLRERLSIGIESELRQVLEMPARDMSKLWSKVSGPPVCASRMCDHYDSCFYYRARKGAEKAQIVITNHSVVLMDAILKASSEGAVSMLGAYDFLIVDEAHDLPQAAANSLEFELNENKLAIIAGLAARMEQSVAPAAEWGKDLKAWLDLCDGFRMRLEAARNRLLDVAEGLGRSGVLSATPAEVFAHPQVRAASIPQAVPRLKEIADDIALAVDGFTAQTRRMLQTWRDSGNLLPDQAAAATDAVKTYSMYLTEYAWGCRMLFAEGDSSAASDEPVPVLREDVSVTHLAAGRETAVNVRRDIVDFAGPLTDLLWDKTPYACLSATLALDASFDFFNRVTGTKANFEEILPSPFDFVSQAALYVPPAGRIPDPAMARKQGQEDAYFDAMAREVQRLIGLVGGRTLVLFHSRREMEAVRMRVHLPDDLPILMQRAYGAASVGERFRDDLRASLFALRSYWTGFDAPGETLSCVALVRIPFEVPVDPPAVARMAYLQTQGLDPFAVHSLPNAKMMMRQGAGRLIRRIEDRGVIALLDPRLRSKRFGEEILQNFPPMRLFDDAGEACAWVGI
ncbi:MAG: ATP-dependent DNA helicase [Fimbriimonadaceae bacterium]|nr:ATP-dependent DNA helicase [Fimbriimonadaceae bacterium]